MINLFHNLSRSGDYNWLYIFILIGLMVLSLIVSGIVRSQYDKYSKIRPISGIRGIDAVNQMLLANGVTGVNFGTAGGSLQDYYDPRDNSIHLAPEAYSVSSIASIAVSCHEAGHAVQYAKGYGPVKLKTTLLPLASLCSKIAIPVIFIGFILWGFAEHFKFIAIIGVILFAIAALVQLITLPMEFDASKRAIAAIESGNFLTSDEIVGAKKIQRAAAMTYVIAMLSTVVQILRFISILGRRR